MVVWRSGGYSLLLIASLCLIGLILRVLAMRGFKDDTLPATPPLYPITWSSYYGVCLQQGAKQRAETYRFLTRSRATILAPTFTFWDGKLVYWSEADRALCFVASSGDTRWLPLGDRIPKSVKGRLVSVTELSPTQEGILFNLRTGPERVGAYFVSVKKDRVGPVAGAMEARGTDGFATYVFVDEEGGFRLKSASGESRLEGVQIRLSNGDVDWDFSARNDTFCLVKQREVTVIRSGTRSVWTLPDRRNAAGVIIDPVHDRLWFHLFRGFNNGSYLIATEIDGKREGVVATASDPFNRPIRPADRETQELIRQLPVSE